MSADRCRESASGEHEWQDTGFADLDECARCQATRSTRTGETRSKSIKCPGCDLRLAEEDVYGQMKHMTEEHPEIVAERRAESAFWDGWEND